jgi:predicted  nucleic acid-binding Zn-ribbon protein
MALQAEQLLRVQEIDLRIDALLRERAALDDGTASKQELEAVEAALAGARQLLHDLQANQVNAELELKTVEEKKAAMTKRLYDGRVTNPKELAAMDQEIEMFGRQRGRLDERILLLMEEIETTGAEAERLETEGAAARERWQGQVAVFKREAARIQAELGRLTPERKRLEAEIAAGTMRRYEDLRRRAGNLAAVKVVEGICGGCRTSVPAVVLRMAKSGESYTFCENCGRFIFADTQ